METIEHTDKHKESLDDTAILVRSPRPTWQECILFFFTLNLYACFWTFGRARDLKRASKNDFSPWAWFFTPLLGLAQLIAFPRMFAVLKAEEQKGGLVSWKNLEWLWVILLLIFSTLVSFQDKFGLSIWFFFIGFIGIILLFGVLHRRINIWKLSLINKRFYGKANGYHWYEWLSLCIIGPIVSLVIYFLLLEPMFVNKIESFKNGQTIIDDSHGLTYNIHGEGWASVEIGTFSDGSALVEYDGPLFDDHFLLFDWGDSYSLAAASSERIDGIYSTLSDAKCTEHRFFSKDQSSVVADIRCDGKSFGNPVTEMSSFIEVKGRIYELYGYLSDTKIPHRKALKTMMKTSKSFAPL